MQNRMTFTVFFLLFFIPVCGFTDSTLNLNIRFNQIQGLREGDRVIFEQNHIGEVTSVSYGKDGTYTVGISIKKNFLNAATGYSEFYIVDDHQTTGKKAVEVEQIRKGGTPLENGSSVEGSNLKRLSRHHSEHETIEPNHPAHLLQLTAKKRRFRFAGLQGRRWTRLKISLLFGFIALNHIEYGYSQSSSWRKYNRILSSKKRPWTALSSRGVLRKIL